jgi:hypothetical protein
MKRLTILTAGLMLLTHIWGQNYININQRYYGVNVYQSSTGSGYGASLNVNVNVQKFNRILELGMMFDDKNQKIKGVEFIYKYFLGFRSAHFYDNALKPFIYYNFLYRTPTEVIVAPSLLKSADVNSSEIGGKMTTFEQAIGIGAKLKLIKQFYFEGSTGFGVYFGSHYQGSTPHSWGIHLNNYGFVPSFKLGLGFQF